MPIGLNVIVSGYTYSSGGVLTDPSVPVKNAQIDIHGVVLAYARSLDLWGMSGKLDAVVVHADTNGSAEVAGQRHFREVHGFSDPKLRLSMNFYGAPALTLKEFDKYKQDLILGGSLGISLPLGQYDAGRIVNNGTNRWAIKPEIGMSKRLGPVLMELATAVTFFTENTEYLGNQTLKQDPIYSTQAHLVYPEFCT